MDAKRIYALRDRVERTSVSTAVILLSFSNLNAFIIPMDSQRVKETVKKHTDILLQAGHHMNTKKSSLDFLILCSSTSALCAVNLVNG